MFTPEAQERVQALLEQVLRINPGFARAYTGLAWICLNRAIDDGVGVSREQDANRIAAPREAEKALALDPNDPRGHSSPNYILYA